MIVILGATINKVAKNEPWNKHHWVFGLPLALTAFSVAAVDGLTQIAQFSAGTSAISENALIGLIVAIVLSPFAILFAISNHQDYMANYPPNIDPMPEMSNRDWFMANFVGILSLACIIFASSL